MIEEIPCLMLMVNIRLILKVNKLLLRCEMREYFRNFAVSIDTWKQKTEQNIFNLI